MSSRRFINALKIFRKMDHWSSRMHVCSQWIEMKHLIQENQADFNLIINDGSRILEVSPH